MFIKPNAMLSVFTQSYRKTSKVTSFSPDPQTMHRIKIAVP